ncbi:MAG: ribulose-phosphate 3-epimerase [Verrucomicrobia bacterium]|nr:ribulose-phosphate 3-epimerase [Verrucomicrobiota bacterium]
MASPIIAPSILASDYARFGEEARRAEQAGGDWLHVDIMDGHFVPNITFGPEIAAALKRSTNLPLDVHLMIERPDLYVEKFVKAGASRITVHIEAHHPAQETIRQIRESGCLAGVALNPATGCSAIEHLLGEVDLVLCMTVVPGFGGQAFIPEVLEKVRHLARHPARQQRRYYIEVDGGIQVETAVACARAGADAFVAGTSLFGAKDISRAVADLRQAIQRGSEQAG